MKKKLFAMVLCVIMVVAMAVPALAAQPNMPTQFSSGGLHIVTSSGSNNSSVYMHSPDTMAYPYDSWFLKKDLTNHWRLYTAWSHTVGDGATMNRHSNGTSCIIWEDATDRATLNDSVVDLLTVSTGVQRICLEMSPTNNKYLATSGTSLIWTTSGTAFGVYPA